MKLIMAEQADSQGFEPKLKEAIDGLNDEIGEPSGNGLAYDGFNQLYKALPEFPFSVVDGGDVTIAWLNGETPWELRPLALYGGKLIVRDMTEPHDDADRAVYLMLFGSLYVPEEDILRLGKDTVSLAIPQAIANNGDIIAKFTLDENVSFRIGYSAYSFCRDGMLLHTRAYTPKELDSEAMQVRTARTAMVSTVVTIQPTSNTPLTLVVDAHIQASEQIASVNWRVGDQIVPVLSHPIV